MTSPGVHLREITDDNRDAVRALRVRRRQKQFVASVSKSLKEAAKTPEANPWYRGVYRGDEPVGFVLFHPIEPERPADGHCIMRFMIDQRYQRQGIARPALRAAVEFIRREHHVDRVRLSVVPENDHARALYRSEGFAETGELEHGELVMIRTG